MVTKTLKMPRDGTANNSRCDDPDQRAFDDELFETAPYLSCTKKCVPPQESLKNEEPYEKAPRFASSCVFSRYSMDCCP